MVAMVMPRPCFCRPSTDAARYYLRVAMAERELSFEDLLRLATRLNESSADLESLHSLRASASMRRDALPTVREPWAAGGVWSRTERPCIAGVTRKETRFEERA
uniref:Uncharacterized protein n=1 Tax=Haptolina brevifila TaxID=156173 RepID=A0A7S2HW02_9EUKA